MGNRAATGADLDHFNDRHTHRQTAARVELVAAIYLEFGRFQRLAVHD